MKKFTTEEIRDLLNQVYHEEISFSRMVEILNERVSEAEKPNFKDGDFLHSDWDNENITIIFKNRVGDNLYYHASKSCYFGVTVNNDCYWRDGGDFRHATEEEKQELLDALAKEGKRWNAEKKCVEDIPKRKFKAGDKVKIKDGISSKTHNGVGPSFVDTMDKFIGKELTVKEYSSRGWVVFYGGGLEYEFAEDWLEPCVEELKEGDLVIFWNLDKWEAFVGKYNGLLGNGSSFPHQDHRGNRWVNAIKFESVEQFNRFIKGEI